MKNRKRIRNNQGQWEVHSFGELDSFEIHPIGDENGTTILAKIDEECAGTPEEKEKRANLIAVIPELLEAAKNLLAAWDKTNPSLRAALQAAINKAVQS